MSAGRTLNPVSVLHSAAAYGFLKVMAAELGDPNSHMFALGLTSFEVSNGQSRARGPGQPVAARSTPNATQQEPGIHRTGVHGTVAISGSLLLPRLLNDQPIAASQPAMALQPEPHGMGRAPFWSRSETV